MSGMFVSLIMALVLGWAGGWVCARITHDRETNLQATILNELSALLAEKEVRLNRQQQELIKQAAAISLDQWTFDTWVKSGVGISLKSAPSETP